MDMQKISSFLKQLRKDRGLTQEQLAEVLGVAGRTVSRWETGSNMPDLSILIQIAEYYDVEVKEILDGERKSEMMNQEVKETLTKVADYNKLEKEMVSRAGNTAFAIMYLVCALAIVIQLVTAVNLQLVFGETAILVLGGFAYLALVVSRGAWDNAARQKRTPMNDGVLSIVLSGIFTALYALVIGRTGAEESKVAIAVAAFFVGITVVSFAVLRVLAAVSKKNKAQEDT